jgi:hypothetical protein
MQVQGNSTRNATVTENYFQSTPVYCVLTLPKRVHTINSLANIDIALSLPSLNSSCLR